MNPTIFYKGIEYSSGGSTITESNKYKFYATDNRIEDLPEGELEQRLISDIDGVKTYGVDLPVSNVIDKANIYVKENQDFIIDRQGVEQIELHSGTQNIYGGLNTDAVIINGYKVFRGNLDFAKKIKKEDLYNIFSTTTSFSIQILHDTLVITPRMRNTNTYFHYYILENEDTTFTNIYNSSGYTYKIAVDLEKKPKYIGFLYYTPGLITNSTDRYGIVPLLIVLSEDEELLSFDLVTIVGTSSEITPQIADAYAISYYTPRRTETTEYLTPSNIEKQYIDGLSEIRTHLSSSEYASIAEGGIEGYYSSPNFYSDSELTIEITPAVGNVYVDLPTNTLYRYNGESYEVLAD